MTLTSRISKPFTKSDKHNFQPLPSSPKPLGSHKARSKLTKARKPLLPTKLITPASPTQRITSYYRYSELKGHVKSASWSAGSTASASRTRRASKAAIALRQLILDPPESSPSVIRGSPGKSTLPRLRSKDVERLRTQLLKPDSASLVIAHARSLTQSSDEPPVRKGAEPRRAVCLDCDEETAHSLIKDAERIEKVRHDKEKHLAEHKFATLKAPPPAPPRLPVLLSLLEPLTTLAVESAGVQARAQSASDASLLPFGLLLPPSAMSLHRPLAGALPTPETLRRGFDALLNAESKVYLYEGPSHKGMHPPKDRLSIYTYWWGFELVMPPPTLDFLSRAKQISTSLLNLLGIIVYAVPGGTRELAPFVGVLSRFIETEWSVLKAQDKGKGVVCGATWFIPAAIVARPWDFDELSQAEKENFDPAAPEPKRRKIA